MPSNTPTRRILPKIQKNSLIFAVHLWNPIGNEPGTDLGSRPSRTSSTQAGLQATYHQRQNGKRRVIRNLAKLLPRQRSAPETGGKVAVRICTRRSASCASRNSKNKNRTKDVDFQPFSIRSAFAGSRLHEHHAGARTGALNSIQYGSKAFDACTSRGRKWIEAAE